MRTRKTYVAGFVLHGKMGNEIDDDGGTIIIKDSCGQSLWFRIGSVFHSYPRVYEDVGLWVEYQEKHCASPLMGSFLFDFRTFEQLYKRLKQDYDRCKRIRPTKRERREWARRTKINQEKQAWWDGWGRAFSKP
jgi:hypothetical protein